VEFRDVLRHRKMVRAFQPDVLAREVVDRLLQAARVAPSAGFSQGVSFLVLRGPEETGRFWDAVAHADEDSWPNPGLRAAPLLLVPLAGKDVYLDRYAEPDKGWVDRDESRWPVPYWIVDTAFAAMSLLLAAVDEGLGALFFGLDAEGYRSLRDAFGIPSSWDPIGVVAIGRPAEDPIRSSADSRPRKPAHDQVHRGRW
jgi:nitroreductase